MFFLSHYLFIYSVFMNIEEQVMYYVIFYRGFLIVT